ncbi:hypothetical protein D3C81_2022710 [compost metagenome]
MVEQKLLINSCAIVASGYTINRDFESLIGDQRVTKAASRVVSSRVNSVGAHGQRLVSSSAERQKCKRIRINIAAGKRELCENALTYEFRTCTVKGHSRRLL